MNEHSRPTPAAGIPSPAVHTDNEQLRSIITEVVRAELQPIASELADHRAQLLGHARQITDLGESMTKCASAAAHSAEIALAAQRAATDVKDDATKIVESALRIHNASIAVTVDMAVKEAVKPIADEVTGLKTNGADATEALGAIVEELGIEDRVKLGPTPNKDKPPRRTLGGLEKRAKASTFIQALLALVFILEFVVRELAKH